MSLVTAGRAHIRPSSRTYLTFGWYGLGFAGPPVLIGVDSPRVISPALGDGVPVRQSLPMCCRGVPMLPIGASFCLRIPALSRSCLRFQYRHGEDGTDAIGPLRLRSADRKSR